MKQDHLQTDRLLDCAIAAARCAGRHALKNIRRRGEVVRSFRHDVKLQLDLECQARAEALIRKLFPRHAFLGEEAGGRRPRDERAPPAFEWIVDPIDGTVNFSHGLPLWCCSVAVRHRETILAGAVYAPMLDELYAAAADRPALRNGARIRVSKVSSLKRALICTGLDKSASPFAPPFAILRQMYGGTQKCRVLGSAALDLCRVACGHADGYFESGIYLWDIAAGGLIIDRAGGRTETLRTMPGYRCCFVATNGLIHKAFTKLLAPVLPPPTGSGC